MTIIDFRLRPPFKSFLSTLMWDVERTKNVNSRRGYTPTPSILQRSMDALFSEMDACGITMGVAAGRDPRSKIGGVANEDVSELHKKFPTRFVGCAGVDTTDPQGAVREIERWASDPGIRGVVVEPGVSPQPTYPSDAKFSPIYEACSERKLPVLIMGGGNAGPDIEHSNPVHLDRVALNFPNLKIVATHGGWPYVQQMVGVAFRRPNVYVCPDMYLLNSPGCQDYVAAAKSYMQDQFLFATSYPFSPLEEYLKGFLALGFPDKVLEKLLYRNAQTVLGLL